MYPAQLQQVDDGGVGDALDDAVAALEQRVAKEEQATRRAIGKGFHYAAGTIHFVASVVALLLVPLPKDVLLSESLVVVQREDRGGLGQGMDDVSPAVAVVIPHDSDHDVDRMTSLLAGWVSFRRCLCCRTLV